MPLWRHAEPCCPCLLTIVAENLPASRTIHEQKRPRLCRRLGALAPTKPYRGWRRVDGCRTVTRRHHRRLAGVLVVVGLGRGTERADEIRARGQVQPADLDRARDRR